VTYWAEPAAESASEDDHRNHLARLGGFPDGLRQSSRQAGSGHFGGYPAPNPSY